jgi:uncharacterized Ntn-hydrolase superfamily protein
MAVRTDTFAIVARSAETGRLGVAVCASLPAVGAYVPAARAGVGAVAVQGAADPALRRRLLDRLAEGLDAEEALERELADDPGRDARQVAVIGRNGRAAAWTGEGVTGYAGHRAGPEAAVVGSHLAAPEVLAAMDRAFSQSSAHDLPERLMRALEAAAAQGGDARGHRSAALQVVDVDGYPYADLRVDEHPRPLEELRRLVDLAAERILPGYGAWVASLRRGGGTGA